MDHLELNISIFPIFLTFKFTMILQARTTITYGAKNRWRKTDHNNGVTETFSVQVGFRWRKFNSDRGQFRVNRGEAETNEGV